MSVTLELPAVYIDGLTFAKAPQTFWLLNRSPEPNDIDVNQNSTIKLCMATTDPIGITTLDVDLYIDGQAIFLAGVSQPGTGYSGVFIQPDPQTICLEIFPDFPFESFQEVEVRVVYSPDPLTLDEAWTFVAEDLTPPVLEAATPLEQRQLRLTFDEQIEITSTVVDPANYTFEVRSEELGVCPAVSPTITSVEVVDAYTVDLNLDIPMTPQAPYTVTVLDVTDIFGNTIIAPYNFQNFLGYQPAIPDGRDFNLYRMLPQKNRDEDTTQDLLKFVKCIQEVTDLLLTNIDRWTTILDPDLAAEQYVDAMLCDLGNPFQFNLTLAQKRKLVKILVEIYKLKGTAVGIINAIRFFLGVEVEIQPSEVAGSELSEGELGSTALGEEGTFVLGPSSSFFLYAFDVVSPVELTQEQRDIIGDIVDYMKPAHEHLVQIIEPTEPEVIDHLEMGLSELGPEWVLH